MEFTRKLVYPADVETVLDMSLDAGFLAERFARLCRRAPEIRIDAATATATVTGGLDPELLPAQARALVPGDLDMTFTETWEGARAHTSLSVRGAPVALSFDSTLTDSPAGAERVVGGDLTVSVPLFGRRIEQEALARFNLVVDAELAAAARWLDARRP
ncbi:DUF2505 domain-containing protein [Actinomyces sp. B33]|uniref:DUF2505 domain-containing protein n=1 Tax=Actinomyces sp. B33 TaxID=2942131 RepID=UPI002341F562|nr:DUF2505 domain-containing protein [Actinomyces sp. B33]MDC4233879.1 DUF2505 domain-containing protein [Actinomyces sp. B33]